MKNRTLHTKRKAKRGFRSLYARTVNFKQRASAAAANAEDLEGDVPNVGIGRALTVILVLHVIAIAAIYAGTQWKNSDDASSNSVTIDTENVTKKVTATAAAGNIAGKINLEQPKSYADNSGARANAGDVNDRPPLQVNPGRQPRVIRPRINPNLRNSSQPRAVVAIGSYKIKSGDTIYQIARRFKIKQAALMALNPNVKASKIHPGQLINVPAR